MYIVLSGIEGAGKSVATKAIKSVLKLDGKPFTTTREIGGTPICDKIRDVLLHTNFDEVFYPMSELLLFYAGRSQLWGNVIAPALSQNKIVISDRSFLCSYAYQIKAPIKNTISVHTFWAIHKMVLANSRIPDLIIHLHTDTVEESIMRARKSGVVDRIESNDIEFFERAEQGYRDIIKKLKPNLQGVLFLNSSLLNEQQIEGKIKQYLNDNHHLTNQ